MIKIRYLIVLIFAMLLFANSFGQENYINKKQDKKELKSLNCESIFNSIQEGILSHNVESFSKYLSPQTFLNLVNTTSGYYSSNQAVYVLQDFINNYETSIFNYSELNSDERNPYATGTLKYNYKGKGDSANVFISLKRTGKGWKIKQITIN